MILDIIYIYNCPNHPIIINRLVHRQYDTRENSTGNFCCNHRLWCPFPLKNQFLDTKKSITGRLAINPLPQTLQNHLFYPMYQGPKNKNIWCQKNLRLLSDSASSNQSNQSNHPEKSRKPQNTTGQRLGTLTIWWLIHVNTEKDQNPRFFWAKWTHAQIKLHSILNLTPSFTVDIDSRYVAIGFL